MFILATSLILAQNLVELAQKEKERRAKIKSKKSIIITNADLAKHKNRLAVVVSPPIVLKESPKKIKTPMKNIRPVKSKPQSQMEADKMDYQISALELKEKLQRTKEYIQLLMLKINDLWQVFFSLDDSIPKVNIQKRIKQTNQRLKTTKEEEKRIKQQLNQLKSQK